LRHPQPRQAHVERRHAFVGAPVGTRYNFMGLMLQAPFLTERRLCELALTPALVREFWLHAWAPCSSGSVAVTAFFALRSCWRRTGEPGCR
jgi:hypothetical protein